MNQVTNKSESEQTPNMNQGFYAQPRAYLSKDGEYLTLVLPGNMLVRKHVNFFKKILGIEFLPKAQNAATQATA